MIMIITLSIIIVFVIFAAMHSCFTSKAYDYKHTVDPLTKKQDEKK